MKVVKFYRGQILVIIVLGTTIALTVALAVSARTLSSIRQTTFSSRAQAALAAAEAGAEVALARLKSGECLNSGTCVGVIGEISESQTLYAYTVSQGGGSDNPYLLDLVSDTTQEIKLFGSPSGYYAGNAIKVCWYNESLDGSPEKENALEFIYVQDAPSVNRFIYMGADPPGGPDLSSNGFGVPSAGETVYVSGKPVVFNHCQSIPPVGQMFQPLFLRVKALYNNFSAVVVPQLGSPLPLQSYVIESTGQTSDGSVKKKIRVTKSLPALPTIFDFAIFNGSETEPLAK